MQWGIKIRILIALKRNQKLFRTYFNFELKLISREHYEFKMQFKLLNLLWALTKNKLLFLCKILLSVFTFIWKLWRMAHEVFVNTTSQVLGQLVVRYCSWDITILSHNYLLKKTKNLWNSNITHEKYCWNGKGLPEKSIINTYLKFRNEKKEKKNPVRFANFPYTYKYRKMCTHSYLNIFFRITKNVYISRNLELWVGNVP